MGDEVGRVRSRARVPSPEPPPPHPACRLRSRQGLIPAALEKPTQQPRLHPRAAKPDSSPAPFSATEKAAWTCPGLRAAAELAGRSGKILLRRGPLD